MFTDAKTVFYIKTYIYKILKNKIGKDVEVFSTHFGIGGAFIDKYI